MGTAALLGVSQALHPYSIVLYGSIVLLLFAYPLFLHVVERRTNARLNVEPAEDREALRVRERPLKLLLHQAKLREPP